MLGHELRNPLASILSAAELIGGGSGGVADRARYRSVVREQVAVLRRLVDDLLDAARIRQGKVRIVPEPADIRDVVSAAVEQVTPAADARRHRVCLAMPEAPVWSECDPDRMRQVVGNLLENAVKYTEPGGTVWVVVERVAGGGRCEIRVRDTGRGIDPAFLPHVFDVFSQGPEAAGSGDRASGGLGLGLALVRRLVELHGGEVTAASPGPGEGSEFVVSLPLRTLQWRPSTPTPPPPTPPAGRLRVLLADDDYAGSDMLGTLLRTEGHDVCVVHDGDSAMATAATFRPDVVLLDIGMPGRDGFDVAGRLAGGDAVLVAVTGYGGDDDRRRGEESGFDRYLVKPVDIGLLRRVFGEVASGVLRRGGRPRKAVTP